MIKNFSVLWLQPHVFVPEQLHCSKGAVLSHFQLLNYILHKANSVSIVFSGCFSDISKHLTCIFKNRKITVKRKFPNQKTRLIRVLHNHYTNWTKNQIEFHIDLTCVTTSHHTKWPAQTTAQRSFIARVLRYASLF